jgi:TPR repeat protein
MKSIVKVAFCIFVIVLVPDHSARAGRLHGGLAAFNRPDYAAAASRLLLQAERGDSRAQARLCFMYTYGRGVPQSNAEAANWCHRAANQGNSEAQYMLGLLYNKGHGVPEDFVEAYKWLDLAAARASGYKREFPYRIRDSVATKMSPAQIVRAQALAIAWRPIPELRGSVLITGRCAGRENCLAR